MKRNSQIVPKAKHATKPGQEESITYKGMQSATEAVIFQPISLADLPKISRLNSNHPLTSANILALQRTVGNHVVQRLLNQKSSKPVKPETNTSQASSNRTVIQRMICILDPINPSNPDVGRFYEVSKLKERYPDHAVVHIDNADFGSMKLNETLYLTSHGGDGTVAHKSPKELAVLLLNQNLQTGTKIVLGACKGGLFVPKLNASFAEALAQEIRDKSRGLIVVHIEGFTGNSVITESGSYRTKDPVKNDTASQEKTDKIIAEGATEINEAKKFITLSLKSGVSLEAIAEGVAERVPQTFNKLHAHNATVVKSLEAGVTTSSLVDFLKALDPQFTDDPGILDLIRQREHREWSGKTASYIA